MCGKFRTCTIVIAAASLLGGAVASGQAPALVKPAAAPGNVLKHIPAGCMAFVAVNSVEGLATKIDGFIRQISPTGGPMLPMPLLELIKAQAQLGEGFDARGGFALVMLDPQQYELDLVAAITAGKRVRIETVPLVFLIPGKDPAKLLAGYQPVKEGEDYRLPGLGDPPGWARQLGGYVLLSPNRKVVGAVAAAKKSVLSELSAADKLLVARNDATVWLNFRIIGPILDAALRQMQIDAVDIRKRMEKGEAPFVAPQQACKLGMAQGMAFYRPFIKQIEDVALAVRVPKSGIVLEAVVSYLPDSPIGKALTAYKHVPGPLLNRLPNMPYVLAFGGLSGARMPKADQAKLMDQLLVMEPFKSLPAESKAKWRQFVQTSEDLVEATQIFVGRNTTGAGKLGIAVVMQCKSAEKARLMLADSVGMMTEIFRASVRPGAARVPAGPVVKYHKALESLGDRKIDVITIELPEAQPPPMLGSVMKSVFGEDKLRMLVADADDKTLVLTMGGRKEFLAAVLKTAAARGGKIGTDAEAAKSLAMLPRRRVGVGLFSLQNLASLVMDIMKDMAGAQGAAPMPINLRAASAVPFAGAVAIEKNDVRLVGYVPAESIRDVLNMVMGVMMMRMGPPMPPPQDPPGGDF